MYTYNSIANAKPQPAFGSCRHQPYGCYSASKGWAAATAIPLLLATGFINLQAQATETVDVVHRTYNVSGATVEELREAIVAAVKENGNGDGAGSASFVFRPELTYRRSPATCVLGTASVKLEATITLPEWTRSHGADEATVASWRRFRRYVEEHEDHHLKIARTYRDLMEGALRSLPPASDCHRLGEEAVRVVSEMEEKHSAAQSDFDAEERQRSAALGRLNR